MSSTQWIMRKEVDGNKITAKRYKWVKPMDYSSILCYNENRREQIHIYIFTNNIGVHIYPFGGRGRYVLLFPFYLAKLVCVVNLSIPPFMFMIFLLYLDARCRARRHHLHNYKERRCTNENPYFEDDTV